MPILNYTNQQENQIASNITNLSMNVDDDVRILFLKFFRNLKLVKSARIVTARVAMLECKLAAHVTLRHVAALCIQFKSAEDATSGRKCQNPMMS